MSQSTKGRTAPKSMRHKQILDVASENPEASIAELAAEVPSATAELVERVLEEHGDPAEDDEIEVSEQSSDDQSTESASYPAPEDLSSAEYETIRAIQQHPTASQRDLAEKLGVTASTVSNRVNGIDGFDWSNREAFANAVLSDAESEPTESLSSPDGAESTPSPDETVSSTNPDTTATQASNSEQTGSSDGADGRTPESETGAEDGDYSPSETASAAGEVNTTITTFQSTVEDLSEQLAELEGQVETVADGGGSPQPFQDPELVHKVVHACMNSEKISEEEELRILDSLL